MSRTTREEHSRICEQCRRMEVELDRLRLRLNDAEDQVKKLEVKAFPGQGRMLREAEEREADARSAYSEVQHKLDDIKRQERQLRMKMRREESEFSVDDIPEVDVDDIPDATMDDVQPVEIADVPEIEIADVNMPAVDEPEPVREAPVVEETPKEEPHHCEEDHVYEDIEDDGWVRYEEEESRDRSHRERTRTDDILDNVFDKGENLWNQAKNAWRVMNKMDVPQDESLRLEILSQIYEIEAALRQIRASVGSVKVLGAIKATNDLANVKPKITRLSHLVDSARMECPQIHFPDIILPDADGFSLLEDVMSKPGSDHHVSTAAEIDQFLITLSKLKAAVTRMPEREGVVDQI